MSLNFKLLVNLPTENESCILNVCQFQFFSSVMNSSRPVTHWDQDDFFPLPCISISAERKREKLWNMVTFLFIADHFPVALDNWLFVQVSCLSLPVLQAITRLFWNLRLQNQVGNLHTITTCLQSPFWKSLQQKQIYPAPPLSFQGQHNLWQTDQTKIHLQLFGWIPRPSPKGQYISWGVWYFQRGP